MKNYKFTINGNKYSVDVAEIEGQVAKVEVNGTPYEVELEMAVPARPQPAARPAVAAAPARPAAAAAPQAAPATAAPAPTAGNGVPVKSPLPGVILDVFVKVGDTVKTGQHLVLLEAMKMENNIASDKDGVVKEVCVRRQDSVMEGDVLVVIG